MKMTWDTDLEVAAENHAEKCSWNRNRGPTKKNLFATNSTLDVKLAIEEWNGERKFFNFATSECEPGKTCDDYIQVPAAGVEGLLGQELYQSPSSSKIFAKGQGARSLERLR
ncbi:hypothetical protein IHE44_0008354 [Lamprotornis superbus]|uniref:SCP domain-containing protein n=1 Tax=Lamprotornis superbus TaxID=245042 RepID=A0A835NK73_9PASS|nr:hypothetical protein IHE44_0008354 [Lamprotornis superbus]